MWNEKNKKWFWAGCILVLAIFFALLSFRSVHRYLDDELQRAEARHKVPTAERVVFNRSLIAGSIINTDDLATREVPLDFLPHSSIAPQNYQALLGQELKYAVQAGELVLDYHLRPPIQPAFSRRIQNGRRALSIAVDRINSISGLVRPGDLIDIYVSFDYQRRKITAPLLQGVYVLATDQHTDEASQRPTGFTTLTLDVTPEEAAKLVAAKQSAELTAMLRNPGDDHTSVTAVRNDIASLLGLRNPIENLNSQRKVNVIYGNTAQRDHIGALRPTRIYRAPPAVFDLELPFDLSHPRTNEGSEFLPATGAEHAEAYEDRFTDPVFF